MIGVFDSGLGGLTVVREIRALLPKVDIVYLGDTARVPYGNKSDKLIEHYARESIQFLLEQGAKMIIVACNTVSAVALERVKKDYKVPILDVIEPTVRTAAGITRNKKIGAIGTLATIQSGRYSALLKAIDPKIRVYEKATPLLVPLAEEGFDQRPETVKIIRYYLRDLKNQRIDTLILGCTHYPLLTKAIGQAVGTRIKIISSAKSLADDFITNETNLKIVAKGKGALKLNFTDVPPDLGARISKFLGSADFDLKQVGLTEES